MRATGRIRWLTYKVITEELKSFDPALAAKPTILVAAKVDVANPEKLKKLSSDGEAAEAAVFCDLGGDGRRD